MSEEFTGEGGVKIASESSPDHRAMKNRGATVISQAGRGGISTPALKFRAFDVLPKSEGGGMVVTEAHTGVNPAPRQQEVALESLAGLNILPGFGGSVPAPVVGDPTPSVIGDVVPRNDPPQIPVIIQQPTEKPGKRKRATAAPANIVGVIAEPGRAGSVMMAPVVNKSITFIGEFRDEELPCHEVQVEDGWVTIAYPIDDRFKMPAVNKIVEIKGDGFNGRYWFTGIRMRLPHVGLIVAVFGVEPELEEEAK